ncbi:hypothetical protein V6N13_038107 [Hibiscus sabdariffa]
MSLSFLLMTLQQTCPRNQLKSRTLPNALFGAVIPRNAQGCGHPKFLHVTRQYLKDYKPTFLGLVEPCISGNRADQVMTALGYPNSYRIGASRFSNGLWLCWKESVQVEVLLQHFQFLHCRVVYMNFGLSFMLTLVYASHSSTRRKQLWPYLRTLATSICCLWLLMGDFNATVATSERRGDAGSTRACRDFCNFIFESGLRDLGFQGPDFTWSRVLPLLAWIASSVTLCGMNVSLSP